MSTHEEYQRFTPADIRRITREWEKEFPGFKMFKPRCLIRLVGPIIFSIYLEQNRGNDRYFPILGFCAVLVSRAETYSPGKIWNITFRTSSELTLFQHDKLYKDSAAQLKEMSPLPLDGDIPLSQVLLFYKNFTENCLESEYNRAVAEAPALLLGWFGQFEQAEAAVRFTQVQCEKKNQVWWYDRREEGGFEGWLKSLRDRALDRESMRTKYEKYIESNKKLEKMPRGIILPETVSLFS